MRQEVIAAARALSRVGLVTAFGHASYREGDSFYITPPKPLGALEDDDPLSEVSLVGNELPAGVPGEAWVHWAIYNRRPDAGGICRAQPPVATALASASVPILPLHGQGAFLGREVPVFDEARLVREHATGEALAECLGEAGGLVMRGNGAVAVGASVGLAAARMRVLEASAEMNQRAASAGIPRPISEEEFVYWDSVSEEILGRIWAHLRG
ncbi:class II aldolase/adducin family protein [Rubrobacter aplysinae]|uniref:class II aldolase/adducin family protein n=1 Tax=Rubrobacter aplysinae TaxID=909625 RepID=UPI00064BDCAF|nr:class II aldolase/adducin family protein [Rubrobacter aplysinae]